MKCKVKECVKCEKFSPVAIAASLPGEAGNINAPSVVQILSVPIQCERHQPVKQFFFSLTFIFTAFLIFPEH